MSHTDNTIRAFNLTVSTREDISDECVKALCKWISKQCKYALVVCENETGKRHLHAGLFFTDPRNKKKDQDNIWQRLVKPHHPTSIGRIAVHIQACPGKKWVTEYLHKDKDAEQVLSIMPAHVDELDEYYPTQAEQEVLMSAKDKIVDLFYSNHEITYKAWLAEKQYPYSSPQTAAEYFNHRMYVIRDMRCIEDPRRVHMKSVALHKYTVQDGKLTNLEISAFVKESAANDYSH